MTKTNNLAKRAGLYIHIPFCASKCYYCDFSTMPYQDKRIDEYFRYLFEEINYSYENWKDFEFDTIFLGGGTPNYVPSEKIIQLNKLIKSKFNITKEIEYTIECNPEYLKENKVEDYLSCGINRFSIGVQTFNDTILKNLGRLHTGDIAYENIFRLKNLGVKNISLDFIMGLPEQSEKNLLNDLNIIKDLDVNHISYYDLIVEENTRFHFDYKRGNLKLPTEDANRKYYHEVIRFLKNIGIFQYEISNFSKPGFESKHNLKYWHTMPYAAFGLGASGYNGKIRYTNHHRYKDYINLIEHKKAPIDIIDKLSTEDKLFEKIIMNMRLIEGVSTKELLEEFGYDIWKDNKELIKSYEQNNLIRVFGNRIAFTDYGFDISNKFFKDLLI